MRDGSPSLILKTWGTIHSLLTRARSRVVVVGCFGVRSCDDENTATKWDCLWLPIFKSLMMLMPGGAVGFRVGWWWCECYDLRNNQDWVPKAWQTVLPIEYEHACGWGIWRWWSQLVRVSENPFGWVEKHQRVLPTDPWNVRVRDLKFVFSADTVLWSRIRVPRVIEPSLYQIADYCFLVIIGSDKSHEWGVWRSSPEDYNMLIMKMVITKIDIR